MKYLMLVINIILTSIMITFGTLYCVHLFAFDGYRWIACGALVLMAIGNLLYCLLSKNVIKQKKMFGIFMCSAMVASFIADAIITMSAVWGLIMFCLSCCLFFVAFVCVSKFQWSDIIFGLCLAVPIVLVVAMGRIFGFANVGMELLAILYILISSIVLGKAIANVFNARRATEILSLIAYILFYLANFLMLCSKFSAISFFMDMVYLGVYLLSSSLFAFSIWDYTNKEIFLSSDEKVSFGQQLKSRRWAIVSVFVLMLFVGYSTVITFRDFNLANPKITKAQFLEYVGYDLNMPIIEVNTQNNKFPTSKEEYVNADFSITNCEDEEDDFSVEMADKYGDENCVGIRLRGNSTKLARKKPFRIKFDEKQSLLGLKKNKSWVLLADYYDQSYIRNYTAFTIADAFDKLEFTPTPNHVALILNGNFQGLYLLCEQVDEKEGRVNVDDDFDIEKDSDFPFLVEMDEKAYLEGITGIDNFSVEGYPSVEIKFPESDERGATANSDKVYDYINEYINAVFYTLRTGETTKVSFRDTEVGFSDLVNIDSCVDYYLVNEIMHNPDSAAKSIYMHKNKDGLMSFGPIWDFDYSLASEWVVPYEKSYIESANVLCTASRSKIFNTLLRDSEFYTKVTARFDELKQTVLDVTELLKGYKSDLDKLALLDTRMWHGVTGEMQYDMQYDYVRLYLQDRYNYLDKMFDLPHADFVNNI